MLDGTRNLTTIMDFYELTMAAGYLEEGYEDKVSVFDMFFRKIPDGGGFAIMAGLDTFIDAVEHLSFTGADIDYLRGTGVFNEKFLEYLKNFKLHCNIWAIPEGTPIFPREPIVTVEGPSMECQLLETLLLVTFNHQCLVATKANRIVRSAQGRPVMEFGARRAQGYDAAVYGARAAYIGGCASTSCVMAARDFGIPASGTMAHSWVQMFDSEYEAFATYARLYPDGCVLLVDTYNVTKSGVPNAIKVFDEVLKPLGKRPKGIRIDSGDIAYLTKKARKMLDDAGWTDCKITVSNSLDEIIIQDLLIQGAQIDAFGVGERLITSRSEPVFGGVYKLVAIEDHEGNIIPKIKISENAAKITTPHFKKVYRIFSRDTGKAEADLICLRDEEIDFTQPLELFDPSATWKRKVYTNIEAKELLVPIFLNGKRVYEVPELQTSRAYCQRQVDALWDEVKRFENPHNYYVDLSQKLWDIKQALLNSHDMN